MDIRDKAAQLTEYADLEGTELGECWQALIHLANYAEYFRDEFAKALEKEIGQQLAYCKAHAQIVETTETKTITSRTLEFDD